MLTLNVALINKALDIAIADLRNKKKDNPDIASILWDIKLFEETKEQLQNFKKISSYDLHQKHGGRWLGTVRNWIQRKAINGENVNWGSHDQLKMRNGLSVSDLETLACEIAASGIQEVFGNR